MFDIIDVPSGLKVGEAPDEKSAQKEVDRRDKLAKGFRYRYEQPSTKVAT